MRRAAILGLMAAVGCQQLLGIEPGEQRPAGTSSSTGGEGGSGGSGSTSTAGGGGASSVEPEVVASGLYDPKALALDSTHLYFTQVGDEDAMVQAQVDRIELATIEGQQAAPVEALQTAGLIQDKYALALTSNDVVYAQANPNRCNAGGLMGRTTTIFRAPKGGGAKVTLEASQCMYRVAFATIGETHLYSRSLSGTLHEILSGTDAATTTVMTTHPDPVDALAFDGASLYVGTASDLIANAAGLVDPIHPIGARSIRLAAGRLYWLDVQDNVLELLANQVETVAAAPGIVAIDVSERGEVWFVNLSGELHRAGTPEPVVTGLLAPTAIAIDDGHVYWSEAGDAPGTGAISRIERF